MQLRCNRYGLYGRHRQLKLTGDTSSVAFNISHDGSIVVGASYRSDGFAHAVRSINGSALQFIAEPASLTPSTGCRGMAVDSSGAVLLHCEGGSTFLHTNAGADVAIDGGTAVDISLDGKVTIGVGVGSPSQGFRKVGSVTTPLGELHAGGGSSVFATNGDGSVVVGDASLNGGGRAATRWTAALGLGVLPKLVNWYSPVARDVSTDGKVIVGHTKDPSATDDDRHLGRSKRDLNSASSIPRTRTISGMPQNVLRRRELRHRARRALCFS
jgi:uncharacterized membrane protein